MGPTLLLLGMPMLARDVSRTVFAHRRVERNYHEGFWFQEGLIALERQKAFTTPKPFTIMAGITGRRRVARSGGARRYLDVIRGWCGDFPQNGCGGLWELT
jgi:hypothetical protein